MALALTDVKIVSFEWIVLGPLATSLLGAQGATVIKVESHVRPDGGRFIGPFKDGIISPNRSGFFSHQNASKYSVTINLKTDAGKELALKLIRWADVVVENTTPGVMGKLGLDYDNAKTVIPQIIYLSPSVQGQFGPHHTSTGFGQLAAALGGCTHLTGWPDRIPAPCHGAYVDYITARWMPIIILAALDYRRRTGKGQYIDNSILENVAYFFALPVMDNVINNRMWNRAGNRYDYACPHGAFRCRGDDRWVAIAVFTDEEWRALCTVTGHTEWQNDARFATLKERKQNEDVLEEMLTGWTMSHKAEEVESLLQQAGVAASVVETTREVMDDPQLAHRNTFRELEHAEMGAVKHICSASLFPTIEDDWRAAPTLGEHNEMVLKDILGLDGDEIADLYAKGAITTDADYPF